MSIVKINGTPIANVQKFFGVSKSSIKKIMGIDVAAPTYATWNPLDKSANITLSNGNLTATGSGSWSSVRSTVSKTSGKYYCEIIPNNSSSGEYVIIGICDSTMSLTTFTGNTAYSWGWWGHQTSHRYYHNSSYTETGVPSFTNNDVLQIAFDIGSNKLWFGKNGTWNGSGNPATGENPIYSDLDSSSYFVSASLYGSANVLVNFGASSFTYTLPSGFTGLYS